MIEDPLAGLSLFVNVARRRSFTAAAKAMGVSPSAASQAITALERRLAVRLLQRTTRSVGLTEAGARFLARLEPALGDVRSAFETLEGLRDRPAGTLRLDVSRAACRRFVEPRLAEFLAAYPDIRLDVVVEDGLSDIVASGCDAGIRLGESLDREMVAVPIGGDERIAVVGSPSYFAARGKPKHPRELHAHACIEYRRVTAGSVYRWEFTEDGKDFEVEVHGRVVCSDAQLMTRAAVDGVGLAYLLESMVEEELASRALVRVLGDFCPPFAGYFLYYPSRAHVAPKLRALIDFLRPRPGRRRPKAPAQGPKTSPKKPRIASHER
ncbi:MAG: LysR family transcriptional regulator [Myxococcales bacterium]|nr:LysR family transcriptional regulator [Myxococcales bacterium]